MINVIHRRCRWTSQKGVEIVPVDYSKYPVSQGWTDIRYFEVDMKLYEPDLPVMPGKTVPEIAKATGAEISMNATFAYNGHPLGYIIKNEKTVKATSDSPQWSNFIFNTDGSIEVGQVDPNKPEGKKMSFQITPRLVKNSQIHIPLHSEQTPLDVFGGGQYNPFRPRAGGGRLKNGNFLGITADGDNPNFDAGIKIDHFAAVMIHLGVVEGAGFDNGGSVCLARNGEFISGNRRKPHRSLGAALTFKLKKQNNVNINPFANLPKYRDIRNSIRKHPNKQFPDNGIQAKTDIAIHHSLTLTGSAESYANYHIDNHGWPGVGYSFVIEQDGTIKHCNDINLRTYHVGASNDFAIGICLTGDFRTQKPTKAQEESLRLLHEVLKSAMPNYKRTRGHNEFPGYALKQCPMFDFDAVLNSKVIKVLPIVQRSIDVMVNGVMAGEGYLIGNRTYVPILTIGNIFGSEVEGLGNRVNIKKEVN